MLRLITFVFAVLVCAVSYGQYPNLEFDSPVRPIQYSSPAPKVNYVSTLTPTKYVVGKKYIVQGRTMIYKSSAIRNGKTYHKFSPIAYVVVAPPTSNNYQPRWTYPGNIGQHLINSHGQYNISRMTKAQMEALHDSLHEGRSFKNIQNCPNGRCPL